MRVGSWERTSFLGIAAMNEAAGINALACHRDAGVTARITAAAPQDIAIIAAYHAMIASVIPRTAEFKPVCRAQQLDVSSYGRQTRQGPARNGKGYCHLWPERGNPTLFSMARDGVAAARETAGRVRLERYDQD